MRLLRLAQHTPRSIPRRRGANAVLFDRVEVLANPPDGVRPRRLLGLRRLQRGQINRVALEADEDGAPSADVLWRVAGAAGDREHPGRRSPRIAAALLKAPRGDDQDDEADERQRGLVTQGVIHPSLTSVLLNLLRGRPQRHKEA